MKSESYLTCPYHSDFWALALILFILFIFQVLMLTFSKYFYNFIKIIFFFKFNICNFKAGHIKVVQKLSKDHFYNDPDLFFLVASK